MIDTLDRIAHEHRAPLEARRVRSAAGESAPPEREDGRLTVSTNRGGDMCWMTTYGGNVQLEKDAFVRMV
jgi:hypothetical protein